MRNVFQAKYAFTRANGMAIVPNILKPHVELVRGNAARKSLIRVVDVSPNVLEIFSRKRR